MLIVSKLTDKHRKLFCVDRFEADRRLYWLERHLPVKNSTLYKQLSTLNTELILYMMAATRHNGIKRSISRYFTRLRQAKIMVRGKDLIKMGLEPGPIYKEILQAVLDAKLNGQVKSRNDELDFVRDYVSSF